MNQRLHSSVIGMTPYWPTYDSLPPPAASTTAADPPPAPNSADGQIYTLTVLHESPEHGIVWSNDTNALESPVPLAPDISDPSATYESTVDCFNFDSTNYDLADYYAAKPQVQIPHLQQQQQQQTNVSLIGSSPTGHLPQQQQQQHQPASAISLRGTVEGLLNEIQLTSFGERGPLVGLQTATPGHNLYNEPSSYLYDTFAVPEVLKDRRTM